MGSCQTIGHTFLHSLPSERVYPCVPGVTKEVGTLELL